MSKIEISNREIVDLIIKKRWIILFFFFMGLASSIVYELIRPINYTASSSFITAKISETDITRNQNLLQPKIINNELLSLAAKNGITCNIYSNEKNRHRLTIRKDKNNPDIYLVTYESDSIEEARNCLSLFLEKIEQQDNLRYEVMLNEQNKLKELYENAIADIKQHNSLEKKFYLYRIKSEEIKKGSIELHKFKTIDPIKVTKSNGFNLIEKIFLICFISFLSPVLYIFLLTLLKLKEGKFLTEK